jgi:hypothetical protein
LASDARCVREVSGAIGVGRAFLAPAVAATNAGDVALGAAVAATPPGHGAAQVAIAGATTGQRSGTAGTAFAIEAARVGVSTDRDGALRTDPGQRLRDLGSGARGRDGQQRAETIAPRIDAGLDDRGAIGVARARLGPSAQVSEAIRVDRASTARILTAVHGEITLFGVVTLDDAIVVADATE